MRDAGDGLIPAVPQLGEIPTQELTEAGDLRSEFLLQAGAQARIEWGPRHRPHIHRGQPPPFSCPESPLNSRALSRLPNRRSAGTRPNPL